MMGGMNCPLVLYFTLGEIMSRADCGTMTHFSFYGGIALSLMVYAIREGKVEVENGKITDNWVMVDFPHVMAQLGVDAFDGHGWEAYDRGEKVPPQPGDRS